MGMGAAEDFSDQHMRKCQIRRVFGATGDLGAGVHPRHAGPDDFKYAGLAGFIRHRKIGPGLCPGR